MNTRRSHTLFSLLIFAILSIPLVSCGGGGSGSSASVLQLTGQPAFDIALVSVPANVQENRPFAIELMFFAAGSGSPVNLRTDQTVTASVVSGTGNLTGTASMSGNGTNALTFNNLILDAQGTYELQFASPRANQPALTSTIQVGAQYDLEFAAVPASGWTNQTLSVTVQTVDPTSGQPAVPGWAVAVTLSPDSATATGALSGTTTQTINGTSSTTFSVSYSKAETIRLIASAPGFQSVTSSNIAVDGLVFAFAQVPATAVVNGDFTLVVETRSQVSGQPVTPPLPMSATVSVASGSGVLSGTTTAPYSGTSITFSGLRYSQTGQATFTVSNQGTAPATSSAVTFGVDLAVSSSGPTISAPGGALGPFVFTVVDGQGTTWTSAAGTLSWQVVDRNTLAVQQSGNATVTAGVANVSIASIGTVGQYRIEGSIVSPNAASTSLDLEVTNFVEVGAPGPFVALKSVRVGMAYTDSIAYAAPAGTTGYGILSGSLPAGLSLDTVTGDITGAPTVAGSYEFRLYAAIGLPNVTPIRCALAVFSQAETEIVAGQDFGSTGPLSPQGPIYETYSFTSTYDGDTFTTTVQIYYPPLASLTEPAPLFVHHRGRGFNYVDYDNMGAHLASWGIIFATVQDTQSFYDGSGTPPDYRYDNAGGYTPGMESAGAFQEGAAARMLARNANPADQFYGKIDPNKVFLGGHSRGGGATHGSHVRHLENLARGVIYFMAFDLRYFSNVISPPAGGDLYAIPDAQPRLPSLVIAAENDGDLTYPICDQIADRATGPTTFATIYGGIHNYLGDSNYAEGSNYITRAEEQQYIFHLVVAFIRRWADLDLSLDGQLYGDEFAGSTRYGITTLRNMAGAIVVDDFQDGSAADNVLGGANSLTGASRQEDSAFPNSGSIDTTGIKHNILTLTNSSAATYTTSFAAQDLTARKRLVFRCGQTDTSGYDDYVLQVRVRDGNGQTATITLFDRNNQNNTYLPDYTGGSRVYDRFVEVQVLLADFEAANPALDISQIDRVELLFDLTGGPSSTQFYMDDLRFE